MTDSGHCGYPWTLAAFLTSPFDMGQASALEGPHFDAPPASTHPSQGQIHWRVTSVGTVPAFQVPEVSMA